MPATGGTYVATYAYTIAGIRRGIEAGVRSIEHGQMVDQAITPTWIDKVVRRVDEAQRCFYLAKLADRNNNGRTSGMIE